jgi:hypothetical protein
VEAWAKTLLGNRGFKTSALSPGSQSIHPPRARPFPNPSESRGLFPPGTELKDLLYLGSASEPALRSCAAVDRDRFTANHAGHAGGRQRSPAGFAQPSGAFVLPRRPCFLAPNRSEPARDFLRPRLREERQENRLAGRAAYFAVVRGLRPIGQLQRIGGKHLANLMTVASHITPLGETGAFIDLRVTIDRLWITTGVGEGRYLVKERRS